MNWFEPFGPCQCSECQAWEAALPDDFFDHPIVVRPGESLIDRVAEERAREFFDLDAGELVVAIVLLAVLVLAGVCS